MVTVKETQNLGSLQHYGTKDVEFIGKVCVEGLKRRGVDISEELSKKSGIAKEDIDVNTSALYTTAISSFVEKRLRPELVAAGVIKRIAGFDSKGQNSIKVPMRSALITASDLPDSGQVSYDSNTYGSTTITLGYKYAANSLTHEIVKFANVDLIAEELGEIGDAIARKMDSDIVAALQAATTTAGGNKTNLGATASVTFATLVTGLQSAWDNYAKPDVLLCSPQTWNTITQLAQMSGSSSTQIGALALGNTNAFPIVQNVLGMRVVISQLVDNDDLFLIDTARTGYLVETGDVEVFDGRRTGYLAYEVIGAKNYGVSVVQPKAVFRLEENLA